MTIGNATVFSIIHRYCRQSLAVFTDCTKAIPYMNLPQSPVQIAKGTSIALRAYLAWEKAHEHHDGRNMKR